MARKVIIRQRPGWWTARSLRERRLILAMGALIALVLVWFALIRPLSDARATAERRLNAAVTDLAAARGEAAALRQANQAAARAPVPLPLDGFVMQSAGEQGFTNVQVTGDGPARATISTGSVRPQPFFGWIGQLETRGVIVESINASANSDQTIRVTATLRAGAN